MNRAVRTFLFGFLCIVISATAAYAQSAIAGTVTDETGAVLPGVTVEVRSPALIEGVRTATTDAAGRYRVVDLRPGTYAVTFTLVGFSTQVREGIELGAQFTANVDTKLAVGALEETVTVSGRSPIVDVQGTTQRETISQEEIQNLPTGRSFQTFAATMPAISTPGNGGIAQTDVGGSSQMQQGYLAAYGGLAGDMALEIDGMSVMSTLVTGNVPGFYHNVGAYEEVAYQIAGGTADTQTGGVRVNMIPRTGGNSFSGEVLGYYSGSSFQADNVTDELVARGVTQSAGLSENFDVNGSVGGPIIRDKLWFFSSARIFGFNPYVLNQLGPDGNPLVDFNRIQVYTNRLTAQLTPKNKITGVYDRQPRLREYAVPSPGNITWDGAPYQRYKNTFISQVKWTSTVSSQLLIEAGWSLMHHEWTYDQNPAIPAVGSEPEFPYGRVYKRDVVTGLQYSNPVIQRYDLYHSHNWSASMSYVTGSHSLKVGMQLRNGDTYAENTVNGDIIQFYRNGAPYVIAIIRNTPVNNKIDLNYDLGLYVQDSWALGNLTLNPGVRFDLFKSSLPVQEMPAGRWLPARRFEAVDNLPNWKNVSPRFGASYDLFGDGRTAIKGSVGMYVQQEATAFAADFNPATAGSATVSWRDLNGDGEVQGEMGCVYLTPNCEVNLAQVPQGFGVRRNRNPDPDLPRPYQILYNIAVQHELLPGRLGVSASYSYRDFKNINYVNNLAVPFSAYTQLQIPDPRQNGQSITIYNVDPELLTAVDEVLTKSGTNTRTYSGFDLAVNARFGNGATFLAGTSTGRTVNRNCDVTDPNSLRYCDESGLIPMRTAFKASGTYPLPYGIRFSAVLQSVLGNEFIPYYVVTRAVVPELSAAQITTEASDGSSLDGVRLDPPGTSYNDRVTQLDFAVQKSFRLGGVDLRPQVDLFNVFNSAPVLVQNDAFGSALGDVNRIQAGRLVRLGVQVRF